MGIFTNRKLKKLQKLLKADVLDFDNIIKVVSKIEKDGLFEEAREAYLEIYTMSEEDSYTGYAAEKLGRISLAKGELDDALEYFNHSTKLSAENDALAQRYFFLAKAQAAMGRRHSGDNASGLYNLALENYRKAESLNTSNKLQTDISLSYCSLLTYLDKYDEAYQRLNQLESSLNFSDLTEKQWVELYRQLIKASAAVKPDAAPKYIEKALEVAFEDGDRGTILLEQGRLLKSKSRDLAIEKFETAERYLEAAPEYHKKLGDVALELSDLYFEHGMSKQARLEAEKGLKQPNLTDNAKFQLYRFLARAAEKDLDYEDALNAYQQAVSHAVTEDKKALCQIDCGRLFMKMERHDEATSSLRAATSSGLLSENQTSQATFLLAKSYVNANKYYEAEKSLEWLTKRKLPADERVQIYNLLGEVYRINGRVLECIRTFAGLIKIGDEETADLAKDTIRAIRIDMDADKVASILSAAQREELDRLFSETIGEKAFFERLKVGISKTRDNLVGRVEDLVKGKTEIDDEMLEELEEILILSDLGVNTTMTIMEHIHRQVAKRQLNKPEDLVPYLKKEITNILLEHGAVSVDVQKAKPFVMMVVGVNGVGKTTTIAKLANRYSKVGKKVSIAAGDTFRAGAIEQLDVWAKRIGCEFIKHKIGADPSAVVYDAIHAAKSRDIDILIIDTAGRLHTKVNLMEELKKIKRISAREYPGSPHEILLVLDATTGQNAISQAKTFYQAVDVDGIALTKLDGTAKGGIVVTITHELKIPVKFIGIGERMDDLRDFSPELFVEALFATEQRMAVSTKTENVANN